MINQNRNWIYRMPESQYPASLFIFILLKQLLPEFESQNLC